MIHEYVPPFNAVEASFVRFNILLHSCPSLTHLFTSGRCSGSLLKNQDIYDAGATVVGHAAGLGKNKGLTGAFECKMEFGKVGISLIFLMLLQLFIP